MRKLIFLLVGLYSTFFWQCSPKISEDARKEAVEIEREIKETIVDEGFRKTAPEPADAPKINIGKAETFTLDNGLQVIVVEHHKLPFLGFQLSLKNDPLAEGEVVGYQSIMGQMLGRGTTTRSKAEIDAEVDYIGASLSTSARGLYARSLTKHTPQLLEVVTDVLYNPSFPEKELTKIKKQIGSVLEANKTDPQAIMSNLKSRQMYGAAHPYGEVTTPESLEKINLDVIKKYYEQFFVPNNAYLVIVGDISKEGARDIAQEYFGGWERKALPKIENPDVLTPNARQVKFAHKPGAVQSLIHVSYPINLEPGAPDAIHASFMNSILGSGFSSRLVQNIREDKAFSYGAYSSLKPDELVGSFSAVTNVRNEVTDSTITEILYELERLKTEPVPESELNMIKNYITGKFARKLESPQTIASFALNTIKYDLPDDYYETYLQKVNATTAEDIQAVAQKYLRPEEAYVFVVGDEASVAEKLIKFDQDSTLQFYNAYGEESNAVDEEVPEGLTAQDVINNYLKALGGKDKVMAISSFQKTEKGELMGQSITFETAKMNGKMATKIGNDAMIFNETIFDGEKVQMTNMGNSTVIEGGPEVDLAKSQAHIFEQLQYLQDDSRYTLNLVGIKAVDGKPSYHIQITDGENNYDEYYDTATGLLVQSVNTITDNQGGEPTSIISQFKDYKAVEGIMTPHETTITGAMPMPINLTLEKASYNTLENSELFNISK